MAYNISVATLWLVAATLTPPHIDEEIPPRNSFVPQMPLADVYQIAWGASSPKIFMVSIFYSTKGTKNHVWAIHCASLRSALM
jgi:hypothetical protein